MDDRARAIMVACEVASRRGMAFQPGGYSPLHAVAEVWEEPADELPIIQVAAVRLGVPRTWAWCLLFGWDGELALIAFHPDAYALGQALRVRFAVDAGEPLAEIADPCGGCEAPAGETCSDDCPTRRADDARGG